MIRVRAQSPTCLCLKGCRWFEQTHPEFALDTMRQMFPEEHLGDGFFIAKFKRKQDNG